MEKTARKQYLLKWQLILGVVVCAVVAFCTMPWGVCVKASAAETKTVEYVDSVWNEEAGELEETKKSQECTVLDEEQCDEDLNDGWYVLNSTFTYNKHVNINENQDVKIILKDDCTLTATRKGFSVKDGATLTVYGQSKGNGTLVLDGNSGDAGLRVGPTSTLNIKGGTIRAEGTSGGAGIGGDDGEAAGTINIYGGDVTAEGGKKAYGIGGDGGGSVNIYGGTVTAIGDDVNYDIGDKSVNVFVSEKAKIQGLYLPDEPKTVKYVDREWDEKLCTVKEEPKTHDGCTSLTSFGLKNGLGKKGEEKWYVLDSNLVYTYKDPINISGDVHLILKDDCVLTQETYYAIEHLRICVKPGSTLTIYGQEKGNGKIDKLEGNYTRSGIHVPKGATLNIKGGIIEAEGTSGGAGIGGDDGEEAGTINIYGGTVNATGGKYGAGIGGGDEGNGGTTTISGGTVTATGGKYGAGIGGGDYGKGGTTTISGGTVTATGGNRGAGIGGGKCGKGGTTEIYGGDVIAKGYNGGAGIGGGDYGNGGEVTIYGGTVMATGGGRGAGIGGGYSGNGGNTIISGGTVRAYGGSSGAGIGGGYWGNGGTTNIYGGTVTATGGDYGAGIGGGNAYMSYLSPETYKEKEVVKGGEGGTTTISGGIVTAKGGEKGDNIGHGQSAKKSGTTTITGGNIKGCSNHTITLKGVTEEVEVVGVDIDYGVNDVYTLHDVKKDEAGNESLDEGKLYFYMSDEEYAKLTKITVRYKDGKEEAYYKTEDPNIFSKKSPVTIIGVEVQNGVYNGLPQQGYTGTPTNEQGYDGEYEVTYYLSNGEKTTLENSGAEGEHQAPVYAGDYKVRIAVPSSNVDYGGSCELEFKVEKATPEIVEQPTLSGVYGTAVEDMNISGGVVKVSNSKISGTWKVTDLKGTDIPDVGTTESYEITFTPTDTRNKNAVTTMVVPEVEKVNATVVEIPSLSGSYGTAVKDMEISGGVVKVGETEIEGTWKVTDLRGTDVLEVGTTEAYEVTFIPKSDNYTTVTTMVVPEVIEIPTMSEPTLTSTSDENKQKLIEKVKGKLSDPKVKSKLSDSEVRNNIKAKVAEVKEKITNSELIKDEEVREKLLNFI